MKNLKLLFLLLFACSSALSAQRLKNRYPDHVAEGEEVIAASYQRILTKTADGAFLQKVFYPEKKIMTHLFTYSDPKFKVLNGPYKEWYDNGHTWKEGSFKDNRPDGFWTIYNFDTGAKKEYGYYENGMQEGKWVSLDEEGRVTTEEHYRAGMLHGESRYFDKEGQLVILRTYENGELKNGEKLAAGSPVDTLKILEVFPHLRECANEDPVIQKACSDRKMLESMYKQIKYPKKAREMGVEGTAILRFVIEKDGSIDDLVALRGLSADIEAECMRIIRQLPKWNPGQQNGEAVRVEFNLPVKFKLE